jgi:hypothetical protein
MGFCVQSMHNDILATSILRGLKRSKNLEAWAMSAMPICLFLTLERRPGKISMCK